MFVPEQGWPEGYYPSLSVDVDPGKSWMWSCRRGISTAGLFVPVLREDVDMLLSGVASAAEARTADMRG